MLVNVADPPGNRAYFGTTGTADGSSPFPQVRIVALTARAGRAIRGAVLGTARGEQTLLKTLVSEQPGLFAGRVVLFDRNFRAPRGALPYRPRSGCRPEEVSVGLMAYLDP